MNSIKASCYLILVLIVSACSSVQQYEGEKRSEEEVAVLIANKKDNLFVSRINSKHRGIGNIERMEFLPGTYTLQVNYLSPSIGALTSGTLDLEATFEAGKKYQLKKKLDDKSWFPWIEDLETGKSVSSQVE